MTPPEVTFGRVELGQSRRGQVRHALRRIRFDLVDGAWTSPVDEVEITGVLSGGLSGALVLSADLYFGDHRLSRVVKIAPSAELAAEWESYVQVIKPLTNALFAPIVAATPDVVDRDVAALGFGAIVYDHAARFTGRPGEPLRTFEDVVRAALDGTATALDHACDAIARLVRGTASVLYNRVEVSPAASTLRSMNPSLGPNVVLLVDGIDQNGALHYGHPDRERSAWAWLPDDDLLRRTLGGPGAVPQLAAGDDITLSSLRVERTGRQLLLRGDDIRVEIQPVGPDRPEWLAELTERRELAVHGRIAQTRGSVLRARLLAALESIGPVRVTDDGWVVDTTAVADPFDAVLDVLTNPVSRRVRSVVHGDLNPRNVLLVGDQPCLIDYSHTGSGQPQQADFCWLELGLLRDVFAGLGFSALVAVQRWLALAARMLDLESGDTAAPALAACVGLVSRQAPELAVPFRVLLEIRRLGRMVHPTASGQSWHHAHLEQLLLAAHRTAKWTDAGQTPEKLGAAVAVAAVATEQLVGSNAFCRWTSSDLVAAITAVEPALPLADDEAGVLLHELVTASPETAAAIEAVLASARTRLVRTRCAVRVRGIVAEFGEVHDEYVELMASIPAEPVGDDAISLIVAQPQVILCGAPGSGKTTVLRELAYRLASSIRVAGGTEATPIRFPVLIDAPAIVQLLADMDGPAEIVAALLADSGLAGVAAVALDLGAPYLLVDNVDRLGPGEQLAVMTWLAELCERYPRVRLLVCRRKPGEPGVLGPHIVRLRDFGMGAMRLYLRLTLAPVRIRDLDIEHLLRMLLEEPEWQRLRPERPGVLSMIARHVRRAGLRNGTTVLGDFVTESLFGATSASAPRPDALALVCETIATWLLDERADEVSIDRIRSRFTADPEELLEHLVSRDVLHRADDRIAFADPAHRDYFAARGLCRNRSTATIDRVFLPNWHGAIRVFVTLSGADQAEDLVRAASSVAPVLAAMLRGEAAHADADLITSFVEDQRRVLADDAADDEEISEAASALAMLDSLTSLRVLRMIAADDTYRTASRAAALNGLAAQHGRTASRRPERLGSLVAAVTQALTEPGPERLRLTALDLIAAHGLRGFELFLGQLATPGEPWPVAHAAVATLRELGVVLPGPIISAHQAGIRRRLGELDQLLSTQTVLGQARSHQRERADLLAWLKGPGAAAVLLAHRFDFRSGPAAADRLREVIAEESAPDPGLAPWSILTGRVAPHEWTRVLLGSDDPVEVAAAAQRLLWEAPGNARSILAEIGVDASPQRLLIAAELVASAGDAGLEHAERLVRALLPVVDDARITGLAALLCAIAERQRELGVRLAWTAAEAFAARDLKARHHWSWAAALARCQGGIVELTKLLDADDESAALAEAALASRAFPRRCGTGRRLPFEPPALRRMLDRAPGADSGEWECVRWALATANMDLVEALPALRAMASRLIDRPGVLEMGTAHSGVIDWAPLADVLAVLGYLARRVFDQATEQAPVDRELHEVCQLMSELDTADTHPSVAAGRAIALAYLGDCSALVHGVAAGWPVGQPGRNAIRLWTPGPYTPRMLSGNVELARWMGVQRDRPGISATARAVLTQLTREAEHKAGVLIPRGRTAGIAPHRTP